jgi:hypothetical protein
MSSPPTDLEQKQDPRAFVRARQQRYIERHNNLDVPKFMLWFSDDVDYSDLGLGAEHLSHTQLSALAAQPCFPRLRI